MPLDDATPAAAGASETTSKADLPAMFLAEIQAESKPAPVAKAAAKTPVAPETVETPETDEAPDEAAPVEAQESEAEEAEDTAQAEPDDAAETPSEDPAIAAPSGMSDADKAEFAKLPTEMKAWVTKRVSEQTADYTRKSQVVAEQKRHFDAGLTEVVNKLKALDSHLSQFTDHEIAPPDPALRNSDPMAYDEALAGYMQARHLREVAAKERQRVQGEAERIEAEQRNQWFKEQNEALKTLVPDLFEAEGKASPAKMRQIQDYALKSGYSRNQLEAASAIDIQTLWKAQKYDAIEAAKKAVKPVAAVAPKSVKPGPAKAVGRPSALSNAMKALEIKPNRENLAQAYLAEIRSEKR